MNENEFGTVTQEREPLPTFEAQPQPVYTVPAQPMYTAPAQPIVQPVIQPNLPGEVAVSALVDSAFGKGLAAVIMGCFPIVSIVAIILGSVALRGVKRARTMAVSYGIGAGGKCIAAKVLGKIGLISGIVMTAFWSLYFFLIILFLSFAGGAV